MREGEQEVKSSTKQFDIAKFKVTTIEKDSMVMNHENKKYLFLP